MAKWDLFRRTKLSQRFHCLPFLLSLLINKDTAEHRLPPALRGGVGARRDECSHNGGSLCLK